MGILISSQIVHEQTGGSDERPVMILPKIFFFFILNFGGMCKMVNDISNHEKVQHSLIIGKLL